MGEERRAIEAAISACQTACAVLGTQATLRTRLLLDMLLLELGRELARLTEGSG